jgi:hypothetical protein
VGTTAADADRYGNPSPGESGDGEKQQIVTVSMGSSSQSRLR